MLQHQNHHVVHLVSSVTAVSSAVSMQATQKHAVLHAEPLD